MAKSKIKNKDTIQIANLAKSSKSAVKKSSPVNAKNKAKASRTEKQKQAAAKNLEKARQAKQNYMLLRKRGFNNASIIEATRTIENFLAQSDLMRTEENPAVARLFDEIGGFKSEEELSSLSKGEFYKYATSIREFLNNPLSLEEANKYLQDRIRARLIKAELTQGQGEEREAYLDRRLRFIKSDEDREKQAKDAFRIYRMVMETNAGQIIKAKMSPAAYGSDNLIADIMDFVTSGAWSDNDDNKARAYWEKIINDQYNQNLRDLQIADSREAIEIPDFSWRGVMAYDSFVPPSQKR